MDVRKYMHGWISQLSAYVVKCKTKCKTRDFSSELRYVVHLIYQHVIVVLYRTLNMLAYMTIRITEVKPLPEKIH